MKKGFEFVKGSSNGSEVTHFFKNSEFFNLADEMKNQDLTACLLASAKYGGPIAATYNSARKTIGQKLDDSLRNRINFYNNNGTILKSNFFTSMPNIAVFEFLEDEILLVVYVTGGYLLVHPLKGCVREGSLGSQFQNQKIESGNAVENGVVFFTQKQKKFYYVLNLLEGDKHEAIPFIEPSSDLSSGEFFYGLPFVAVPASLTTDKKLTVIVPCQPTGVEYLLENYQKVICMDKEPIQHGASPILKKIIMMAVSTPYSEDNSKTKGTVNFAFLTDEKEVHVVTDFNPKSFWTTKVDYNEGIESKKPKDLMFCGKDTVILYFQRSFLIITENGTKLVTLDKVMMFYGFPEIDGLRFIMQTGEKATCSIFRKAPKSYMKIFKSASFDPAAILYQVSKEFLKKNPSPDTEIRNNKENLCQAVQDCLDAATFEISEKRQKKLLQAASYGKAFLTPEALDPNILAEKCKELKVLYNVKKETLARTITYEQLHHMNEKHLIKILMRYNAHYLAYRICTFRNLPEDVVSSIYINWALKKVENESDKASDVLCKEIYTKLKDQPGISYTEIAHKAAEVGKEELAVLLLEKEVSASRKVPILLWMKDYNRNYEKALEEAAKANDSNLIYLCIIKIIRNFPELPQAFEKFVNSKVLQTHMLNYLTLNSKMSERIDFLKFLGANDELGYECIARASAANNLTERIDFLKLSLSFWSAKFRDFPGDKLSKIVTRYIETNTQLKEACAKSKTIFPMKNISMTLEELVTSKPKSVKDFQKLTDISERRVVFAQLTELAKAREWKKFDDLVSSKNTKKVEFIPFEDIVEIIHDYTGEVKKIEQYIEKITDEDMQLNFWSGYKMWRKAAEIYSAKKKANFLQILFEKCNDDGSRYFIEKKLKEL